MEALLASVAASDVSVLLRQSRLGYAALNGAHVLGIALLVGAIVPMNLRLLGVWPCEERAGLVRVLAPMAASGLALAVTSGLLLFAVRAPSYAALPIFLVKMGLVALGAGSAITLHRRYGWTLAAAGKRQLCLGAALSMACWLGALACGRSIGFLID